MTLTTVRTANVVTIVWAVPMTMVTTTAETFLLLCLAVEMVVAKCLASKTLCYLWVLFVFNHSELLKKLAVTQS